MRPVLIGLVYHVEDNFPSVLVIFMSRKEISPFSCLSMVNFRDGWRLLMDVSLASISSFSMSHKISSTAPVAEWLRRPPREREVGVQVPAGSNQRPYKIGIFAAVPPGAWHYGNSAKTGRPGVSIL